MNLERLKTGGDKLAAKIEERLKIIVSQLFYKYQLLVIAFHFHFAIGLHVLIGSVGLIMTRLPVEMEQQVGSLELSVISSYLFHHQLQQCPSGQETTFHLHLVG